MNTDASAPGKPPRKRRGRWLLGLLALLLVIAFGISRLLQPEKLGELLLTELNQRSGLTITTREPARVGWWPQLHVELSGLDARLPGDDAPLLQAAALDLSLPLSLLFDAIRGNEPQPRITGLTLRSPSLDLGRLQTWLGPAEGPPAPFALPDVDSPLAIEDGRLLGDGWRIDGLDLQLSGLRAGESSRLNGRLRWAKVPPADDVEPLPISFDISASPGVIDGDLLLDALDIKLQSGEDQASATGSARLSPGDALRTTLDITLPQWPALLPALPLPPDNKSFALTVNFDGLSDGRGQLQIAIASDVDHIEGELTLGDWLGWLGADEADAWLLPPISGSLKATRLQQGEMVMTDAVIDFDDDSVTQQGADGRP